MSSSFFSGPPLPLIPLCKIYLAAAIVAIAPGCLLIGRGQRQEIRFEIEPPGALVRLEAQELTAPGALRAPRRSRPLALEVSAPGRETYSGELTSEASGLGVAVLETVLFLIPGIIDLSGPMYSWPRLVRVTLPPAGTGAPRVTLERSPPARPKAPGAPSPKK